LPLKGSGRLSCVLTGADFDELERAYDDQSFWFVG